MMRSANAWATMYANHVGSLSPEEIEAFVAAIQVDALEAAPDVSNNKFLEIQRIAGEYPDHLFE